MEDNVLTKHDKLHHGGDPGTYSMHVVRMHKTALGRQIHEATLIQHSDADIQMNSKSEYNGPRIPRISIEVGDKVITTRYNGQDHPVSNPGDEKRAGRGQTAPAPAQPVQPLQTTSRRRSGSGALEDQEDPTRRDGEDAEVHQQQRVSTWEEQV